MVNSTGSYINISIYASNIGKPKYIEQKLTDLKGEFDSIQY